jgi:putative transposase
MKSIYPLDFQKSQKITKQMKGFKAFHSADATLSGIELHHMLRKGQHNQSDNQNIFVQFYGLAA